MHVGATSLVWQRDDKTSRWAASCSISDGEGEFVGDEEKMATGSVELASKRRIFEKEFLVPRWHAWETFRESVENQDAPVLTRLEAIEQLSSITWIVGFMHLTGYIITKNFYDRGRSSGKNLSTYTERERLKDLRSLMKTCYLRYAKFVCLKTDYSYGDVLSIHLLDKIAKKLSSRAKYFESDDKTGKVIYVPRVDSRLVTKRIDAEEKRLNRKLSPDEVNAIRFPKPPVFVSTSQIYRNSQGIAAPIDFGPDKVEPTWHPGAQCGEEKLILAEQRTLERTILALHKQILEDREKEVENKQFLKVRHAALRKYFGLSEDEGSKYGQKEKIADEFGISIEDMDLERDLIKDRFEAALKRKFPDLFKEMVERKKAKKRAKDLEKAKKNTTTSAKSLHQEEGS